MRLHHSVVLACLASSALALPVPSNVESGLILNIRRDVAPEYTHSIVGRSPEPKQNPTQPNVPVIPPPPLSNPVIPPPPGPAPPPPRPHTPPPPPRRPAPPRPAPTPRPAPPPRPATS